MEHETEVREVLSAFAHYGFKKASMDDLARAAGVSRQTLYSRFKTKEGVLDWAVERYLEHMTDLASAALKGPGSVEKCLLKSFAYRVGDSVPFFRAPHGAEVLDLGAAALQRMKVNPYARFEKVLTKFLRERGVCTTQREADDMAFLLSTASKGLMLKAASSEDFDKGMARIIRAAVMPVGDLQEA